MNVKNTKHSLQVCEYEDNNHILQVCEYEDTRSATYLSVGGGDGLVAPLAPDHAVVGESVVDEVLGGGGSQGEQGQARESLHR